MSPSPHRSPSPAAVQALARVSVAAGDLVRGERQRRSLTMRELAQHAGVSAAVIAHIEAGHPASLETYARLSTALGLRLELALVDPRRRSGPSREADLVHAAMGEAEARRLRAHGFDVGLDVPYQHYQFAGRADVLAWDLERRALLHVENRTRFPNLQEAFGSYNAKRAYLAADVAERIGLGGGWRSETHVIVALWSAEVLHSLRLRTASFEAVCPDPADAFAAWWSGEPPAQGQTSCLVVLDPHPGGPAARRRRFIGLAERSVPPSGGN
jgi:transcriptional regulator with XRE-family HTH domain